MQQLILHQGGADQPAKKVSSSVSVRSAITVAPEILTSYVGKYELAPNFVIAITSEHGSLFLQATGQSRFEMFAESETSWFLKEVDAQVTFEKDKKGRVRQLILHQNGQGHAWTWYRMMYFVVFCLSPFDARSTDTDSSSVHTGQVLPGLWP